VEPRKEEVLLDSYNSDWDRTWDLQTNGLMLTSGLNLSDSQNGGRNDNGFPRIGALPALHFTAQVIVYRSNYY
jgi:hypothetical protein